MNRLHQTIIIAGTALLATGSTWAQGILNPTGAPAASMKTLSQIETRTPISSLPYTINQPGSYYVATNLSVSSGYGITVLTNGVSIDLGGWTLSSTANPATGIGIYLSASTDVTIYNGHIKGGVTNNAGTFNGPGWQSGIVGSSGMNLFVENVDVTGTSLYGIYLGYGTSLANLVKNCRVRNTGNAGITASVVESSIVAQCGGDGVLGYLLRDCQGEALTGGYAILGSVVANCRGSSQGGTGVHGQQIENCYGAGGTGVYGTSVANSYGYGSNYGINATDVANSFGYGTGSGTGIKATTLVGCGGNASGSGVGIDATDGVASVCRGASASGIGIRAAIGQACWIASGTTNITHKYNMP